MSRVSATEARRDFFERIREVIRTREPLTIRHREGEVVVIPEEDYEGLLETLELLSEPGFRDGLREAEEDIAAGRTVPMEQILPHE